MQNFVKILFCFLVLTLFVILAPKEIQMELNTIIDDEPNLYIKDEGLCFFTLNNSVEEVNDKSNNTIFLKNCKFFQNKKQKNSSNVIKDSNGNPMINEVYNKAIYYAFHPDDKFG